MIRNKLNEHIKLQLVSCLQGFMMCKFEKKKKKDKFLHPLDHMWFSVSRLRVGSLSH